MTTQMFAQMEAATESSTQPGLPERPGQATRLPAEPEAGAHQPARSREVRKPEDWVGDCLFECYNY